MYREVKKFHAFYLAQSQGTHVYLVNVRPKSNILCTIVVEKLFRKNRGDVICSLFKKFLPPTSHYYLDGELQRKDTFVCSVSFATKTLHNTDCSSQVKK